MAGMIVLDAVATFAKLDKLRARMARLEKNPDSNEWQYTRLLIRALTEVITKSKKCPIPVTRKIRGDAPEAVSMEWRELVSALSKKGIDSEKTRRSSLQAR